ncbi:hypothetical protein OCL06_12945 [Alteromonas sp. ASW11-19]|uniref:Uncharacterized protein n=1 Tax=Alteromonas salexigens TaxID=2982530 RepID=A0ABT2VQA9_9ALTE|nr:hypothetical protein [Alteromonas salexigens]MCU7555496.1 hypothetical protein [Alteromonas salexigens]
MQESAVPFSSASELEAAIHALWENSDNTSGNPVTVEVRCQFPDSAQLGYFLNDPETARLGTPVFSTVDPGQVSFPVPDVLAPLPLGEFCAMLSEQVSLYRGALCGCELSLVPFHTDPRQLCEDLVIGPHDGSELAAHHAFVDYFAEEFGMLGFSRIGDVTLSQQGTARYLLHRPSRTLVKIVASHSLDGGRLTLMTWLSDGQVIASPAVEEKVSPVTDIPCCPLNHTHYPETQFQAHLQRVEAYRDSHMLVTAVPVESESDILALEDTLAAARQRDSGQVSQYTVSDEI